MMFGQHLDKDLNIKIIQDLGKLRTENRLLQAVWRVLSWGDSIKKSKLVNE